MTAVSCLTPGEEKISEKNLLAMELVEDDVRLPVPNYLVDTKIYSRVARNAFVQAQPSEIHFGGFELAPDGQNALCYRRSVRLVNVASEVTRFHIVPPEDTAHFTLKYTKPARLVPGFAVECVVEFRPDESRYYYDALRIHTKDEENNLVVPIHAYPVLGAELPFPKFLKFGLVPVGYRKKKVLPVRCNAPVDFEFKIAITQDHPAIQIEPLEGVIPANGSVDVEVTFAPVDFVTAHLSLEFRISQFNSQPLICHISGGSEPGMERNRVVKEWAEGRQISSLSEDVAALDPRVQSPLDRARTRKVQRLKGKDEKMEEKEEKGPSPEVLNRNPGSVIERSGLRIPTQLDSPFSVAQVLSQEPGKLKIKELREVLNKGENRVDATRQMKEAIFEQEVRQDVYEERQNQLRWQIRVGDEPIASGKKLEILNQRTLAWTLYQRKRGVPVPEEELQRSESAVLLRRTFRDSGLTASETLAKFDRFQNDDWAARQSCLDRFRQAARKVIIRHRAESKIRGLKQLLLDWGRGKYAFKTTDDTRQKEEEQEAEELMMELASDASKIVIHRVTSQRFASWGETPSLATSIKSTGKGPQHFSVAPTDIILRPNYDFFGLKVPQVFRLNNYDPIDVQTASGGYVPVRAIRQFKIGALDEIISLPPPVSLLPEEEPLAVEDLEDRSPEPAALPEEEEEELALRRALLKPPASLFRPLRYPPLHIFNPAPGLQVFEQPQPYGETDPDFRLCPLPRYVARSAAESNPFTSTQRRYLDREDIIRGTANWKTFPSLGLTSLGNTPTLTSVWVPRWSDAFVSELLPTSGPALVDGLPQEDEQNLLELDEDGEEKQVVALTPDMVIAEFQLGGIDTSLAEVPENADANPEVTEEFPFGTKMPPSNIPVSAQGPVPRWTREKELEFFLNKKSNRLGSRVNTRVRQMDQLVRFTHQLPLN